MEYFGYPVVNPYRSHTPAGFYDKKKGHTGIDIICPKGTPLSLPTKFTVELINKQQEMGLTLYMSDENDEVWVFSHLDTIKAKLGDRIKPGEVFALTGNSGTASTGPHVHLEIIAGLPEKGLEFMTRSLAGYDGYNVDPIKRLDAILTPHWSAEKMAYLLEHEVISFNRDPEQQVTWGEYSVSLANAMERMMEWTDNKIAEALDRYSL